MARAVAPPVRAAESGASDDPIAQGIGVLITDHNVRETLEIVDRACIIYGGQVLFAGNPTELVANTEVRRLYLGENFQL